MTAVLRAARGGLGARRLQPVIIGLVALAATAASTLAVGLLVDAHSPFDRAFAAQHGAHVSVTVDTTLDTSAQLAATRQLPGVTAAAGPFAMVSAAGTVTLPGDSEIALPQLQIVGRPSPGGSVDDLTLDTGHWPRNDGQIVLSRTGATGAIGSVVTVASQRLRLVGVADSVTNTAQAWVLPSEVSRLVGSGSGQAQLLYRFAGAGTSSEIAADIAAVRSSLPAGSLLSSTSYLSVRQSEQSHIAPWVPFIVAFGLITLLISLFIVVNVVSGAVTAGTTRIGVLKSIGFTPAQVVASYVVLVTIPALIGCLAGAVCGNLLALPLLRQNARVYEVGALGIPVWVDVLVPLAVLALTAAAALVPSVRAGRMSAVQAIATGRAPRPAHGYLAHRRLAGMTAVPRAVTLGLAAPASRPARTTITVAAIVSGAAAVTFGAGLATSLDRAFADTSQSSALPVQVSVIPTAHPGSTGSPGRKIGPMGMTTAQARAVTSALAAQPGTRHYVPLAYDDLNLPGLGDVSVTAYGGNPSWSGLALISGRWYSNSPQAPEAVVNTLFLSDTGTSVGSTYTVTSGGERTTVKIVGEVFQPGNDLNMYMSPASLATLDPSTGTQQYGVALEPGTNAQAYANALSASLGSSYWVQTSGSENAQLIAVLTLVATLTILIMIVAGLGVLNTVALQIRERAHDMGVFKAIGMTPRQTIAMIVCSVAAVGLAAGIVAVPAGILLHHAVLPSMAHAANSGVPASLLTVYSGSEIVALALSGVAIAIAGALGPAIWAARIRTASALRSE